MNLVAGFGLIPVWVWIGFSEASAEPSEPPPTDPDRAPKAEIQVGARPDPDDGERRGDYRGE